MTHRARTFTCLFVLPAFVAMAGLLLADPSQHVPASQKKKGEKPSITNHLRLRKNMEDESTALQTSIVRYVPASGKGDLVVDLIGVVHIGDAGYYEYLNRHFDQYDAVLYELVAPPERRIPDPSEGSDNPMRLLQKLTQSVLDLKHQLDFIDYRKDNLVHADMSPSEMAAAVKERGDNGMTLFLSVTADMLRQQNLKQRALEERPEKQLKIEEIDPFEIMFDDFGSVKMKRIMAQQFADLSGAGSGLGQTLDTILIKDRNGAAMQVFQKQLAEGKKKIGIFYGAAHMPDFEQRLVRDFGLKRDDVQWVTAWDLSMKRKSPVEGVVGSLIEEFLKQSLKK